VTGVAAGSATITATSEGKSATSAVTVTNVPVASVTVTPAIASLVVGATVQLTATPKDALGNPLSGRVVTWSSNAPGVAAVSGTVLVTGLGAGVVTITATSEGVSGTAAINRHPHQRHRQGLLCRARGQRREPVHRRRPLLHDGARRPTHEVRET